MSYLRAADSPPHPDKVGKFYLAKRMKHRCDVGGSGCSENESGSIGLYLLEFRKKILRTARQKRVAII